MFASIPSEIGPAQIPTDGTLTITVDPVLDGIVPGRRDGDCFHFYFRIWARGVVEKMKFPIYLLLKDCGEIVKYDSVYSMQYDLEAIDIVNHEYQAWDAEGKSLELGTQKPVWIRMEEGASDVGALARAMEGFAVSKGIEVKNAPFSMGEIEALLGSVFRKKG